MGTLRIKPWNVESEAEDYIQQAARNVAATPGRLYKTVRSGLGIGDILGALEKRSERKATPKTIREEYGPLSDEQVQNILQAQETNYAPFKFLRKTLLPTHEEAGRELEKLGVDPRYHEERPGDIFYSFLQSEVPAMAMGGLPKTGLQLLGRLGIGGAGQLGGMLGSRAGQALGEQVDEPELGQLAGGLAGQVGARGLTSKGIQALQRRLARPELEKGVRGAEEERIKEFEKGKEEFEQEKAAREEQIQKQAEKDITEQEQIVSKKDLEAKQKKALFEKQREAKVKRGVSEVENLEKRAEQLHEQAQDNYQLAEQAGTQGKAPATGLQRTIKQIQKNLSGAAKDVKGPMQNVIQDIKGLIKGKKGQKSTLSVDQAINLKKNINAQIFDKNVPKRFKQLARPIVAELDNIILKGGNPELVKSYQKANNLFSQAKKLKEQAIAKEKLFPRERRKIAATAAPTDAIALDQQLAQQAKFNIRQIKDKRARLLRKLGQEKYDKITDPRKQEMLADALKGIDDKVKGSELAKTGLYSFFGGAIGNLKAALGLSKTIGKVMGKNDRYRNTVEFALKNYPEVYDSYTKLIDNIAKPDPNYRVIGAQLKDINEKIKKKIKKNPRVRFVKRKKD